MFRPGLFAGRAVLVTGGGSGIGRCVAHELASLGAEVTIAGRDLEKLERVVAEIAAAGGRAFAHRADVRDEAEVAALVDAMAARHGRIDGLVNNAGGQFVSPAESLSKRGFEAVLATNLTGTFLVSREVVRASMSAHGGAIVNVVADMWRGMPMMAHSGAARAGVVNLTQTTALEWSSYGVRVNAVAPGIIASSGLSRYPEMVQEALKSIPAELPARRFGTESEVSAAIVFLLSPAAAYVSGATLRVDAGSSLYRHPFALPEHAPFPTFDGFGGEEG